MKIFKAITFCLLTLCLVWTAVSYISISARKALAGGENTTGYAWSENIGWISFNDNNSGSGGGTYGVHIDEGTGNLSGYAWSSNIGWISFNRADTGNPPAAPFNGGTGPIAQIDPNTREITGWMRVLANGGGWDGWIELRNVFLNEDGDWSGWGWSDMVVGWICFNSDNSNSGGGDYRVNTSMALPNPSPSATNLKVVHYEDCTNPSELFTWNYSDPDGDPQSWLHFQVDDNSDFTSPEVFRNFTWNEPQNTTNTQVVLVGNSPQFDQIVYNKHYHWRVKVVDSNGIDSGWVLGPEFDTRLHHFPLVGFSVSPDPPKVNENTQITSNSICFDAWANPVPCVSWEWTIPDAIYVNGTSDTSENPVVRFTSKGPKTISVVVTDADGYSCPGEEVVDAASTTAEFKWKEIIPRD